MARYRLIDKSRSAGVDPRARCHLQRHPIRARLNEDIEHHIYYRDFDPWERGFLSKAVKPGWVTIDAGANVGYYSLLLS
jgi:hypothetical protein